MTQTANFLQKKMTSKPILKKTNANTQVSKIPIIFAFINFFIYGALVLMIGWTQGGLRKVLFSDSDQTYMVYLLVSQSVGLIIGTLFVKKLMKHFNIRWIFVGGYGFSFVLLLLIAFIDQISGADGVTTNGTAIALFLIFSFLFGCAIAPISPLVSTFLSAIYHGHKQVQMLCVSNGIYGIGAGIVPLAASQTIYDLSNNSFGSVKYFYFIAAGLAIIGAVGGYFVNYRHSEQLTSGKIIKKDEVSFEIWKPLLIAIGIMSGYMIAETIGNYMFTNVSNSEAYLDGRDADKIGVTTQQAFGLFVMTQGVWRAFSGIFVLPKMKKTTFVMGSATILLVGLSLSLAGFLKDDWGKYLIAVLFGFGYGSMWPVIYSYANSIDQRRASFIGMIMNVVSMFWIPTTQLIAAVLWNSADASTPNALFYSPLILAVVAIVISFGLTILGIAYFRRFRTRNNLDEHGVIITKK